LCVIKKPRKNEEATARNWAVKDTTQWVVTPGKQTPDLIYEVLGEMLWLADCSL